MSIHTTIYPQKSKFSTNRFMISNDGLDVYQWSGAWWLVEWKHVPTDIKIEALRIRLSQITDWQGGVDYYTERIEELQAQYDKDLAEYAEADQPYTAADFCMEPRL